MKKRKLISIIAVTVIILISFFSVLYVIGIRSEPYAVAIDFIRSNTVITERLGELEYIRLAFFGYSVRYHGPNGYAEYKIYVIGNAAKGTVYLDLIKSVGIWDVVKGNLLLADGTSYSLMNERNHAN
jgi:hypothetical protein